MMRKCRTSKTKRETTERKLEALFEVERLGMGTLSESRGN